MEAKFNIDTGQLIEEIIRGIVKELRPLLLEGQDPDELFDVKGLSQYLGVSPDWVYKKTALKEIPYIKLGGGLIKFKKSQVEKWLGEQNIKPIPPLKIIGIKKTPS
jgi:excisionase family DNA binding protein